MNEEITRHIEEIERMVRIDELMKEWATYCHSQKPTYCHSPKPIFVEDGPFPYYWNQKIKILFIGRELYGKRNENDPLTIKYWDEREGMQKLGVFQSRLLYLAYGILHGECSEEAWEKMDTATKLNSVFATGKNEAFSYAFMNASKILNEDSSKVGEVFTAFVNDKVNRAFFVREIELLAPDIIISGNLNDLRFWEFEEFKARLKQHNDRNCHKDDCFVWKYEIGGKTILLLDGHHFSARGETFEKFYEPICKVAKVFLDEDNFKLN